jgi:transposase
VHTSLLGKDGTFTRGGGGWDDPERLRKWIRQAAVDEGQARGVTSEAVKEIREFKRKVSELERMIEILTAAARSFAREHDPLHR